MSLSVTVEYPTGSEIDRQSTDSSNSKVTVKTLAMALLTLVLYNLRTGS